MGLRRMAYEAKGWGVGELWVEDELLVWHELPRPAGPPRASSRSVGGRRPPELLSAQRTGGGGLGEPGGPPSFPASAAETETDGKPSRAESATISELAERLQGYFAGAPTSFQKVPLDLSWCTLFQHAVATALRRIPWGETVTYGELAALAGYPNAQRAAGTFCARNRFPILVPCHRVVAADGIGSYGSLGIEYKRRLLELEHVAL